MPRGVYERQDWMFPQHTESRSDTLTRQQYATRKIQEFQRTEAPGWDFDELLFHFKRFGLEYDSQQRRAA